MVERTFVCWRFAFYIALGDCVGHGHSYFLDDFDGGVKFLGRWVEFPAGEKIDV